MPDCIIMQIIKLGKKSKHKRTADCLMFINQHKEQFAWENYDFEDTEDLVDPDPIPIPHSNILAELLGIDQEADHLNDSIIEEPIADKLLIGEAAAANANLTMPSMTDEITGVNEHGEDLAVISDDESDDDDDKIAAELVNKDAVQHDTIDVDVDNVVDDVDDDADVPPDNGTTDNNQPEDDEQQDMPILTYQSDSESDDKDDGPQRQTTIW